MTKLARYAIAALLGLVWLAPLYLLVANALRPVEQLATSSVWALPRGFDLWENVMTAQERMDILASLGSSLLYATASTLLAVVVGALAGFAIVVLRLRHGFAWFMLIFGGTIFPGQMLLVPLFIGYSTLGLYDRRPGLVLAYTAILVPLAAFVMRNFFTRVAYSIYEAAALDGAGPWRAFWRIYLPLSWSALAAIFILEFTVIWNELLLGLVLTQSEAVRPVTVTLAALSSAYAGSTAPVELAAGLLLSLPTVLLFLATQRLFARGLALSQL